jgi:N-glycosylase/DNA lyase
VRYLSKNRVFILLQVADCICLMSLGHLEAIPVDTHIYQVAVQRYLPHLGGRKTVTDKVYDEIGNHFRSLFGSLAGWAHTVSTVAI